MNYTELLYKLNKEVCHVSKSVNWISLQVTGATGNLVEKQFIATIYVDRYD